MPLPKRRSLLLFIFLFASLFGKGQVCTGSLGDPVVNVDFGNGGTGNIVPRVNNYSYTTTSCPDDGSYTIVHQTFNCFASTWYDVPEDHTPGDVAGNMMLVNASFQPGDFYVDTVRGLCPDITYEFAAWILNILRPSSCAFAGIKPNLSFQIATKTGTVLGSYNSGDVEGTYSPEWKQFGLFFTTPGGVDEVVLRITNNAPGGCGNDLVLDDITFRPCGPAVSAAIQLNGTTTTVDICEDDSRAFDMKGNVSAGFRNPALQWQLSLDGGPWTDIEGAHSSNYLRNTTRPGNYRYRLSVAEPGNIGSLNCRVASNVLTIGVHAIPVLNASVKKPVCVGGSIALHAEGGTVYLWTGPDGFSAAEPEPVFPATLEKSGKYVIAASSIPGCSQTDSIIVQVHPQPPVNAGADQTACEGVPVTLDAATALACAWSPATGLSSAAIPNPVANISDTTIFTLTVTDENACTNSDSVIVNILRKPAANAGQDLIIFEGSPASLNGAAEGTGVRFFWTPASFMDNSNTLTPVVQPTDNTVYTLHVVSEVGCGTALEDVFVRVLKKVVIPNAFSPNGDGINDTWRIVNLDTYPEANLTVFNRYGKPVFTSMGYNKPWDGNFQGAPLPAGTYYYVADLKNGIPRMSGWVFIVR